MKKILLFITTLLIYNSSFSQIINIPDVNFKNALINYGPTVDTNNDGEIEVSEVQNIITLNIKNKNITDLTGIEFFTSLYQLNCSDNQLTSFDLSQSTNLQYLYCGNNQLNLLNVIQNNSLVILHCYNNQLTSLDVSNNIDLRAIACSNNQLTSLDTSQITNLNVLSFENNLLSNIDVSQNDRLMTLNCSNNPNLTYINLKNGNNDILDISGDYSSNIENTPSLQTVCVDNLNTDLTAFILAEVGHSVTFTEYCSFTPVNSNVIRGVAKFDTNDDGCDTDDLPLTNLLVTTGNGTENFGTYIQNDGSYLLYTNNGTFTTTITTNLPNYWTVSPSYLGNNFIGFNHEFIANFCVNTTQVIDDVIISIIPKNEPRPGFNTEYRLVYKNIGTTERSGDIHFTFNDLKLNFLNASENITTQTSNSLGFNYMNLKPFEIKFIDLEFSVNPPTGALPTNIDDILNFTASISPTTGDYTIDNNTFVLNQTVIGSYDPNDITCIEGDKVLLTDINKYLHYVIRFQNTGTASAINIVVKNILDTNLDWSTFQLEDSSHNQRVSIKNNNEVEFIFENINLLNSTIDEPNSHGFIAYKIKPKSNITLGETIPNKVDIFFDYNAAIETNTTTTTIVNTLSIKNNDLLYFSVYPTPTNDIVNVLSKTKVAKIFIYTKFGQLISSNINKKSIDISNLSSGLYFCKITDELGNSGVRKLIRK